jgi:hypothetical protein
MSLLNEIDKTESQSCCIKWTAMVVGLNHVEKIRLSGHQKANCSTASKFVEAWGKISYVLAFLPKMEQTSGRS